MPFKYWKESVYSESHQTLSICLLRYEYNDKEPFFSNTSNVKDNISFWKPPWSSDTNAFKDIVASESRYVCSNTSTFKDKDVSESPHVCSNTSTIKFRDQRSFWKPPFFVQIRVHSKIQKLLKATVLVQIWLHSKIKKLLKVTVFCSDTSTYTEREASERCHVCSDTSTFKDKEASERCHVCSDMRHEYIQNKKKLLKAAMFVQIRVLLKLRKLLKVAMFVQIRVHRPPGHRRGDHATGAQQLGWDDGVRRGSQSQGKAKVLCDQSGKEDLVWFGRLKQTPGTKETGGPGILQIFSMVKKMWKNCVIICHAYFA